MYACERSVILYISSDIYKTFFLLISLIHLT
jgi:hypothetical protein